MRANYTSLSEILENVIVPHAIPSWMLSDIHPTTAVLENVNVHVSYNLLRPILSRTIQEADKRKIRVGLQEYPLCILDENLAITQEVNLSWYTSYVSEHPFGTGEVVEYAPFSTPSRSYEDQCRKCEARYYCRGIANSYLERYGADFDCSPFLDGGLHTKVRGIAREYLLRTKGIS